LASAYASYRASYRYRTLPNDPAGQKTTGHQQRTSAQGQQRRATRLRERPTSRSSGRRSGSLATSGGSSLATSGGRSSSGASGSSGGSSGVSLSSLALDDDVPTSGYAAETGVDLLLGDVQLLSYGSGAGNVASGGVTVLTLSGSGGLHLRTIDVLDVDVAGYGLGERRSGRGQHHGQHGCQQHYLPQLITSLPEDYLTRRIFSSPPHIVNTVHSIFSNFLNTI
jgi:hypothetical protein